MLTQANWPLPGCSTISLMGALFAFTRTMDRWGEGDGQERGPTQPLRGVSKLGMGSFVKSSTGECRGLHSAQYSLARLQPSANGYPGHLLAGMGSGVGAGEEVKIQVVMSRREQKRQDMPPPPPMHRPAAAVAAAAAPVAQAAAGPPGSFQAPAWAGQPTPGAVLEVSKGGQGIIERIALDRPATLFGRSGCLCTLRATKLTPLQETSATVGHVHQQQTFSWRHVYHGAYGSPDEVLLAWWLPTPETKSWACSGRPPRMLCWTTPRCHASMQRCASSAPPSGGCCWTSTARMAPLSAAARSARQVPSAPLQRNHTQTTRLAQAPVHHSWRWTWVRCCCLKTAGPKDPGLLLATQPGWPLGWLYRGFLWSCSPAASCALLPLPGTMPCVLHKGP